MLEYSFIIFADYFQIIFADLASVDKLSTESYEVNLTKYIFVSDGYFTINTLRNYDVNVVIKIFHGEPDVEERICDIVALGEIECRSGTIAVMSPTSYIGDINKFDLPIGNYSVKLCVYDTDSIDFNQTHGEEVYEISFWAQTK